MKKLLLLLLIAPIIGNSQMLNVPVSGVIVLQGFELNNTTVPQGKIWQWTGIGTFFEQEPSNEGLYYGSVHWDYHYGGFVSKYHFFKENQNMSVSFPGNWDCQDCYFTFIEYDINAQPLAYNTPEKIKPTLYPNPTTSKIALNSDKEYQIEVYDMAGNKVMELTGNTIDVSHLSASTYIVRALDKANDEEVSYKIVKN
jgi:hypothetical protein